MPHTSTPRLSLYFFLRLIKNKSHLCKEDHRKEVLGNFRNFISLERHKLGGE